MEIYQVKETKSKQKYVYIKVDSKIKKDDWVNIEKVEMKNGSLHN